MIQSQGDIHLFVESLVQVVRQFQWGMNFQLREMCGVLMYY